MTSQKPYVFLFAGQSNMLGHAKAIDGTKPENPAVKVWDNGGATGTWKTARLGVVPFNTRPGQPNNAALHFADHLARHSGRELYLIGWPVNGSTLLSWSSLRAPNMARMVAEIDTAFASEPLKAAGIVSADGMLWHQGESDDALATMVHEPKLLSAETYGAEFCRMIGELTTMSWWQPGVTRIIAGELIDKGWLAARNDFYRAPNLWPLNTPMTVAASHGIGHVGDRAHLSGEGLAEMGRRMFERWINV